MAKYRKWKRKNFKRKRNYYKKGAKYTKVGYMSVAQKTPCVGTSIGPGAFPATGIVKNTSFTIDTIPNLAAYRKLFDQYRISKVKMVFTSVTNPHTSGNQSYNLSIVSDIDGGTIANYDDLLSFSSCKTYSVDEQRTRITKWITPKVQNLISGGPNIAGTKQVLANQIGSNRWIDFGLYPDAAGNIPHYGVKWGFMGTGPLNNASFWDIDITYYLQFRQVR